MKGISVSSNYTPSTAFVSKLNIGEVTQGVSSQTLNKKYTQSVLHCGRIFSDFRRKRHLPPNISRSIFVLPVFEC